MAEVLSFAMEEILKKAVSLATKEVCLAWGVKRELKNLGESLTMIQARLRDAEQRQVREEAVRLWLKRLKDVAYEADDALDEFAYEVLRREVELQNQIKKKVLNFFSLSNPIAFRFQMAHKVKNINISLEKIKNDAIAFGLNVSRLEPLDATPQFNNETDSFGDNSKVVGRENDVSNIVKMLIDPSNQEVLSVLPVVGMAGLGKTTLAQLVYKDDGIKRHFDARIWVCVSKNFEMKRIFREFLESLLLKKSGMESMSAILEKLQEQLEGKRYLLILDDIWNEDLEKWDSLKSRFLQINTTMGSSIIVTTRSDQVASIMETLPRYHLGKLSEDDCWSIFKDRAFAMGKAPMTPDFEGIGREIVKKCAGVPLAAKLLGGMMVSKKEINEWLLIQNSEIWNLPEENGILPVLKLSFDHLPSSSLKQCFVYCSMFPKGSVIQKDNLVQLWMARGLLQPSQESNLDMEDLGNGYFNILLTNSLFQDATKDECGNITDFKMHDLVHDLAQSISRSESLTLEPYKVNDKLDIRHLSLIPTGEMLPTIPKESARKVRTLFSMGNVFVGNYTLNFNVLRVLNLDGADIWELPISIGKLRHLRYLDVSRTNINAFPKSISKLYNLQTLRLMHCDRLLELPSKLKNLINLRHFCIDDSIATKMNMPLEMGQLTCLQTLPSFAVGHKNGHRIEELGCLKKLRGKLMIHNLEHVRDEEEAKKANLPGKTNIYKLGFRWSSRREGNNNDVDVLEGLQPHANLKSLEIHDFAGDKFPSWMMMMMMMVNTNGSSSMLALNKLVEIRLDNCKKCEQIPMLGHLPYLRDVEIHGMDNVTCIGAEFYGYNQSGGASDGSSGAGETMAAFVGLRRLSLWNMCNLVQWMEAEVKPGEAGMVFPHLEELSLRDCPKLTTAPSHFSSLKELEIESVNSSMPVANISSNITTLTRLRIRNVPNLTSLPEGLLQNNKYLTCLEIIYCSELTFISPHVSGSCTSLQSLVIGRCQKLCYLPDGLHTLMSLERLTIKWCPNLESIPSIHGLTSLRKLEIEYCDGLTSLPNGLESCMSLVDLTVRRCPNLISVPKYLREFPSLSSLTIRECGKLKCFPEGLHCLTRLKTLDIGPFSKELDSFPNFEDIQHLKVLTLRGWPKLKSLPDQLQHLTALKTLYIVNFDGVEALPDWLGNLNSLESLYIWKCKNLMHLPTEEAMRCLTKLQYLTIEDCPPLKERCVKESGPEWSKISHIPEIMIDFQHIQSKLHELD